VRSPRRRATTPVVAAETRAIDAIAQAPAPLFHGAMLVAPNQIQILSAFRIEIAIERQEHRLAGEWVVRGPAANTMPAP
jgi:hypothetical protein